MKGSKLLGPLTRQALLDAGLSPELLERIADGTLVWEIGPAPAVGRSADEAVAAESARASRARNGFLFRAGRAPATGAEPDRWVVRAEIPRALGQRIVRVFRYESATADRGAAASQLFVPGDIDSWIDLDGERTWSSTAYEFRVAADLLATHHGAAVVFPTSALLYLCRHHLELSLKTLIERGNALQELQVPQGQVSGVPNKHPLRPLWNRVEPTIRRVWEASDWSETEFDAARSVVDEFESFDSGSYAMRYPVATDGAIIARPDALAQFDLAAFMGRFRTASDFLSDALGWIEVRVASHDPWSSQS